MKKPEENKSNPPDGFFFDIHCHAVNISHAGLLAFVNRFLQDNAITYSDVLEGNVMKKLLEMPRKRGKRHVVWRVLKWSPVVVFILVLAALLLTLVHGGNAGIFPLLIRILNAIALVGLLALVLGLLFLLLKGVLLLITWLSGKKPRLRLKRLVNLLSIMENDCATMFQRMKEDFDQNIDKAQEKLDHKIDTVVLTPLLMDFGYKGFDGLDSIHYSKAPNKPIVEQVVDVFLGIDAFTRHQTSPDSQAKNPQYLIFPFLGLNTQNYKCGAIIDLPPNIPTAMEVISRLELDDAVKIVKIPKTIKATRKLDEANPAPLCDKLIFTKITPQTLCALQALQIPDLDKTLKTIKRKTTRGEKHTPVNTLPSMLHKYFGEYKRDFSEFEKNFEKTFSNKSHSFDISRLLRSRGQGSKNEKSKDEKGMASFFFAGIKLYPPLGFDPWPIEEAPSHIKEEGVKVLYLYQFCQDRGIPITVHCSPGGFVADRDFMIKSDPKKWVQVLKAYPELYVNFAHFGIPDDYSDKEIPGWTKTILELIDKFNHVYADVSCRGMSREFYKRLDSWIQEWCRENKKKQGKIDEHILFGSDFSIHLTKIDSYSRYLSNFFSADLDNETVRRYAVENPWRFLFEQTSLNMEDAEKEPKMG